MRTQPSARSAAAPPRWLRASARACGVGLAVCIALAATAQGGEPLPGDYRVTAGRVDRGTYAGWRVFHSTCHACHGVGGVGSDIAPNLIERVGNMTPRAFAAKVLTSYRLVTPGDNGALGERENTLDELMRRDRDNQRGRIVMPAWDTDDAVPPHVLDLYAYLSARADGQLGPGRPMPPLLRNR